MNILPKKRWHVRTRENITRVRRDEAKAAEEEKAINFRIQKAETEARTNLLRNRARLKYDGRQIVDGDDEADGGKSSLSAPSEHINFFVDVEDGRTDYNKPNVEHGIEKKEEQEKYEKQIGYLTYLGQDTNEATGNKSWYNVLPKRITDADKKDGMKEGIGAKVKFLNDPLNDIRKYLKIIGSTSSIDVKVFESKIIKGESSKLKREASDSDSSNKECKKNKKRKSKKSKKHKKSKIEEPTMNINLNKLRAERLKRENAEKLKAQMLLAKLNGESIEPPVNEAPKPVIQQKYNSQFNPEIAKQNAERIHRR